MTRSLLHVVVLIAASGSVAQSPSPITSDGLELLTRVSKRYTDAKSFHIRAVVEYAAGNELEHYWEKKTLEASEAPQGKYRYEVYSGKGHAVRVSDGKQVWNYHVDEHAYTVAPETANASERRSLLPVENALYEVRNLCREIVQWSRTYKSATRLPDANLQFEGESVPCYVIGIKDSDHRNRRAYQSSETTIWIRKADEAVLKVSSRSRGVNPVGAARIPMDTDSTTTYSIAELDDVIPDAVFAFVPPPDVHTVEQFSTDVSAGLLEGKMLPKLTFTTADGRSVSSESLRGKPLLLDVWASWCVPFAEEFKLLDAVYQRVKDKMTVVTIDQDEDPKSAEQFLAKNHYSWLNIHDDGSITNMLGGTVGFPRTIVVDSDGRVVSDMTGYEDWEFRNEMSALGPEYRALIPAAPTDAQASSKNKK